jgi:hypothetical protein
MKRGRESSDEYPGARHLPLALILSPLLMGRLLDTDPYTQAALFTLLILPPPFIIPLYMNPDADDERR